METDKQADALAVFGLTAHQTTKAASARTDAPGGFAIVMRRCRTYGAAHGNSGAGLLMFLIDQGEHFKAQLAIDDDAAPAVAPKKTGKRFVRGTHWRGLIDDPEGTD